MVMVSSSLGSTGGPSGRDRQHPPARTGCTSGEPRIRGRSGLVGGGARSRRWSAWHPTNRRLRCGRRTGGSPRRSRRTGRPPLRRCWPGTGSRPVTRSVSRGGRCPRPVRRAEASATRNRPTSCGAAGPVGRAGGCRGRGPTVAAADAVRAVRALPDDPDSARLLALAGGTAVNYASGTRGEEVIEEAATRAARWGLDASWRAARLSGSRPTGPAVRAGSSAPSRPEPWPTSRRARRVDIAELSPVTGLALLTLATSRRRAPAAGRETGDELDRAWRDLEAAVHPTVVAPWAALRAAWEAPPASAASAAAWDAALTATHRRVPFGWRVDALLAAARDCARAGRTARAGILAAAARELVDGAGASGLVHDVQEVERSLQRAAAGVRRGTRGGRPAGRG